MNKNRVLVILIFLLWTFTAIGQEKEFDLKETKMTVKMENQPLGLIFRFLMEKYDVPIGFEQSSLDRGHSDFDFEVNLPSVAQTETLDDKYIKITTKAKRKFTAKDHLITINVKNGLLEDVLNQIVKQMQNYSWEINDGVVNIYPIDGRDEKFVKLLNTNIKSYSLEKGQTVNEITTQIIALPELYKFLKANNLKFTGIRAGVDLLINAQYGRTLDVGMNFSNLTFRELLNKITKIKKGGWILKMKKSSKPTGEEHIDIDI